MFNHHYFSYPNEAKILESVNDTVLNFKNQTNVEYLKKRASALNIFSIQSATCFQCEKNIRHYF